jgi:hypothetical protein
MIDNRKFPITQLTTENGAVFLRWHWLFELLLVQ